MSYKLPHNQRPSLKVILVGSSGVGKTCLISSYLKQTFDENKTSTVAPSYSYTDVKNSKGISVRLQIWDTAGQERYHSVSQLFFRDSDLAFLCFEAGDEASFKTVPDWVRSIRNEVPTCDLFFVITKSDIHSKEEIEQCKSTAEYQFAQYDPKGIFITSAKTKEGVQEVFEAAVELYKPKNAQVKAPLSETKQKQRDGSCCK